MAKAKTTQEKIQALYELATKNTEQGEMDSAMKKVDELCKKYGFMVVDGKVVKDPSFQGAAQEMDWFDTAELNTYMSKLMAGILAALDIEYEFIMDGRKAAGLKAKCTQDTANAIKKAAEQMVQDEASLYRKYAKSGLSKGFREMFIENFEMGIAGNKDNNVAEMSYNALQAIKATMA